MSGSGLFITAMNGLHLIADLYCCGGTDGALREREILETMCVQECRDAGLTPLGAYFYQFFDDTGEAAGVTGTVVLAESHLAIHTWPESGDVTLDVYVCNYSRDNSDRARRVFRRVIEKMSPENSIVHTVVRGAPPEADGRAAGAPQRETPLSPDRPGRNAGAPS